MKKIVAFAIAAVMGITLLSSTIIAGEKKEEQKSDKPQHVYGKVEVVKDGDNITEIKLVGKKETLCVVLDDKGKELAAMDGKEVVVKGEKDAEGKITVSEFKEKLSKVPKKEKAEKAEKDKEEKKDKTE